MSKCLLFIFLTIFFLNGCSLSNDIEKNIIKIKNSSFFKKKSKYVVVNFDSALEKIILEMLKSKNILIFNKTLFFINILENKSSILINKYKLTNLIKDVISKNNKKIYFVQNEEIEKTKKQLGILNVKNSIDTNTLIILSRNNNAKYYLHSCISGKNEPFSLKIKLILVKTGEIVFVKNEKFYHMR